MNERTGRDAKLIAFLKEFSKKNYSTLPNPTQLLHYYNNSTLKNPTLKQIPPRTLPVPRHIIHEPLTLSIISRFGGILEFFY